MPMNNKPRVNHQLLPHTTMSIRDKSVIDELHPMIILKAKVICYLNINFWMSYSNDQFFYKTMYLLWATNFCGLTADFSHLPILSWAFTVRNVSTTYIGSFTRGGIYLCLLLPCTYFHFYICNRATLLDVAQRYRVHQSITKHNVDSYHALTPMSCDVPMHNAMRCATTCLSHTTYVMNVIWTTQTTQFIMCHGQLY